MAMLVAILANLILLSASGADAACTVNQCDSQLNAGACIELGNFEELDCYTYTCLYSPTVGHGVLLQDPGQTKRCQIDGQCYSLGAGPNKCTFCAEDANGVATPILGCQKGDECHPIDSVFQDGCSVRRCTVEHSTVTTKLVATTGCQGPSKCFDVGQSFDDITCNECRRDPETNKHEWYRECRDWRNGQCFPGGAVHDIRCKIYVCSNRYGIGWHYHGGQSCTVSFENKDCVAYNTTSPRDGFCYACDSAVGGDPIVTCLSDCGDCVRDGESVQCNGQTFTCGNVDDPPPEDEIECIIGGKTLKVDEKTTFECNVYECTRHGPLQKTFECSFGGNCYKPGDIVDEAKCARCFNDGTSSGIEQGCRFNDKCYSVDETIRKACRNKVCTKVGDMYRFIDSSIQPTPCQCFDKCYPIGKFTYGNNQLCAECFEDGSVTFACRLSNGQCLKAGEEETVPSAGCYRMRCDYDPVTRIYKMTKVPGQPFRCEIGGVCRNEGETGEQDGRTFGCHQGACSFMNTSIPVGDIYVYKCHEFGCREALIGNKKYFQVYFHKYACQFGDSCLDLGKEYEKDCDIYKCGLSDKPNALAKEVLVRRRCSCDGTCLDVGESYWSTHCNRRECQSDFTMKVVEKGCKSTLLTTCIQLNKTVTVNGQSETCTEDKTVDEPGSGNPDFANSVCVVDGTEIPFGSNLTKNCNDWVCGEVQGQVKLSIIGTAKCMFTDGRCWDAGTTESCYACKINTATGHPYPEKVGCNEDGLCVQYGQEVDYRCGRAQCDTTSGQLIPLSTGCYDVNGNCSKIGVRTIVQAGWSCLCVDGGQWTDCLPTD